MFVGCAEDEPSAREAGMEKARGRRKLREGGST